MSLSGTETLINKFFSKVDNEIEKFTFTAETLRLLRIKNKAIFLFFFLESLN